jgi:hypothetical protein
MQVSVLSAEILAMSLHLTQAHKTNKHRMPLAMFVGLNHQLLNVVLRQSLLRDESSNSFKWLFKTFKACMGRRETHVLLTGKCWFFLPFTSAYPASCNTL